MKVTLKVDAELVPVITRAIKEYIDRSMTDMQVVAPTPNKQSTSKPAAPKKRGRPRGSKTKKPTVVLAAQAA